MYMYVQCLLHVLSAVFVYLSVHLSICLSVCLSVCLSACLPACLPVCLTVCLCLSGARFALKLLDKKRIKAKKGEHLALNERNMLAKVSWWITSRNVNTLSHTCPLCYTQDSSVCELVDLHAGGLVSPTGGQSVCGEPVLRLSNE